MPIGNLYSRLLLLILVFAAPPGGFAQGPAHRETAAIGQTVGMNALSAETKTRAQTLTLWPAVDGGRVRLDFRRWNLGCGDDFLYVYDGPTAAAPLLDVYGCDNPASLSASPWNESGALTLVFIADGFFGPADWAANASTECRAEFQRTRVLPAPAGGLDTLRLRFAPPEGVRVRWEVSANGRDFQPWPSLGARTWAALPDDPRCRWARAVLEGCPADAAPARTRHDRPLAQKQKAESSGARTFSEGCAPCPDELDASAELNLVCEGSCTFLNAEGRFSRTVGDDFNSGVDFSLWQTTNGAANQNCGSPDGTPSLWFGSDALPREAETVALDTRWGCNIGFDIRLGAGPDPDPNGCEDLEKPAENPMFQYFDGTNWITLQVFDGAGLGNPGPWGSWGHVCIDLPPAARAAGSRFRWVQYEHDLRGFDQWAIDNVSIDISSPNVVYQWTGPGILSGANTNRPAVCPTAPTTYTVTATDGDNVLTETVFVDVLTADQIAGRVTGGKTICTGGPTGAMTLVDYTGDVLYWEKSVGCTGVWELVFVQSPTFAETNVKETTCYRAVVEFGQCRGPSQETRIEVPVPVPGRIIADYEEVPCESVPVEYTLVDYVGDIVGWVLSDETLPGTQNQSVFVSGPSANLSVLVKVPGCPDSTAIYSDSITVEIDGTPPLAPQQAFIIPDQYFPPECADEDPKKAYIIGVPPDWIYYWEMKYADGGDWFRVPDSEEKDTLRSDTVFRLGTCFRAIVKLDTVSNECDTLSSRQPPEVCIREVPCPEPCSIPLEQVCWDDGSPVQLCPAACDSVIAWQRVETPVYADCSVPSLNWQNMPYDPAAGCQTVPPPVPDVQVCYRVILAVNGDLTQVRPGGLTYVVRYPDFEGGVLAAAPPNGCATANGGQIELSGYDPTAQIVQWEYAEISAPANWQAITNQTPVQAYASLTETRLYRVLLRKDYDPNPTGFFWCQVYSDTLTIEISPETQAGQLINNFDVCVGQPAGFMSLTGQVGRVQRWEMSIGGCGGPWGLLTNSPITDFRPGVIPQDRCYRVVVKSGNCLEKTTPPALVRVLDPPSGGFVAGAQSVCLGNPGPELSIVGSNGTVARWQSSLDCAAGPWADIPGATSATYQVPILPQSLCYRAVITNGACEAFSTPGQVTVLPQTVPGRLFGVEEVCIGTPVDLLLTESRGTVKAWEWTTDGGTNWNSIDLQDTDYTTHPLTEDICYRGVFQSGTCPVAYSNVLCIRVELPPSGKFNPDPSPCLGDPVGEVRLTEYTGVIRQWEEDLGCFGVWAPVNGTAGVEARNYGVLAEPLCLRVLMGGVLCPDEYTPTLRLTVNEPTVAGTLSSPPPICAGQIPSITLSGRRGQVLVWQRRPIGGNWTDIPESAGATFFPGFPLFETSDIQVEVQNGPCPAENTPVVRVEVVQPPDPGSIEGPDIVCPNEDPVTLRHVGAAAPIIRWEQTFGACDSPFWTTIANNVSTVEVGVVFGPTCYRAVVAGTPPCAEVYSDSFFVDSHPMPYPGFVMGDLEVCAASASPRLEIMGHIGDVRRWQVSADDGDTWTNIETTSTVLEPPAITGPRLYRVEIGVADCESVFSQPARVNLKPETLGGRVIGEQTVCRGQSAGPLQLIEHRGRVIGWEASKVNDQDWFPIGKADNDAIHSGRLTVDTWFRAVVQNEDCNVERSEPVLIRVREAAPVGTLTGGRTVCAETVNAVLLLFGGQRGIAAWESRAEGDAEWRSLPNAANVYVTGPLTRATDFRVRFAPDACSQQVYSNEVSVRLNLPPVGGRVDEDHTVCRGQASELLRLAGWRGEIRGWEFSKDENAWHEMGKAGVDALRSGRLTVRTGFRVKVVSEGCPAVYSEPAWVDVARPMRPGILTADQTAGCGSLRPTLRLIDADPETGVWERSDDGENWFALEYQGDVYRPLLTASAWFRFRLLNNYCQAATQSNTIQITISQEPTAGTAGDAATVCRGMGGAPLWARDFRGEILRWEASKDNGRTWFSIGKEGQSEIASGRLTVSTWFRPVIGSAGCAAEVSPPSVLIEVIDRDEELAVGPVEGPAIACAGEPATFNWNRPDAGTLERWVVRDGAAELIFPPQGGSLTLPLNGPGAVVTAEVRTPCGNLATAVLAVDVRQPVRPWVAVQTGCGNTGLIEVGPAPDLRRVEISGGSFRAVIDAPPFARVVPLGDYDIEVRDAAGCRSVELATVRQAPPAGPPVLQALPFAGQAVVIWQATPGPVVYRVAYRVVGAAQWETLPETSELQATLRGLQANTAYEVEIRVRCADAGPNAGESAGPRREFRTPTEPGATGRCADGPPWAMPTGFKIDRLTAQEVAVSWDTIPDAAGFIVSCGLDFLPHNQWPQWVVCQPKHSFVIDGLSPGRSYGVHVRTNCTNCTTAQQSTDRRSAWSRRIDFQTPQYREAASDGAETAAVAAEIILYPNPADASVSIAYELADKRARPVLEVFDLMGRRILHRQLESAAGVEQVETSTWSPGLYVFRLDRWTQKVLIVR